MSLPKLEAGNKYLFRNLLFLGNRSVITPDSEWNIFHLQRFMEINDEVCIEVNGHINLPGREKVRVGSSNFELSVARAIVIKKKLIEGGIVKDRMRVKGNGNWEMKYPNAKTPEQTQQNRRVEIGVLNCETLNSESGDTLEDLERYRFHVINRKYSARLLLSDLEYLAQMEGVSITLEAEKMKSKGLDPSKYTYRELHFAHHNLAKPKE